SVKKTCTAVSDSLKSNICNYNKENPNKTQVQIAEHFNTQDPNWNLECSTISKILKEKDRWLAVVKDNTTSDSFRHKKAAYFAKALSLPDNELKFSNGWIRQFKKRNGLRNFKLHGEAGSNIIQSYALNDVFNADETGLFFRMVPNQTLASRSRSGWKKESILSHYSCNATGTKKLKPIVIGSSIEPRALFGIHYANLPVTYRANAKAWMRSDIFADHFNPNSNSSDEEPDHSDPEELHSTSNATPNSQQSRANRQSKGKCGRSQASVYTLPDLSNYQPTNVQIKFLPALTTSHLQSIDAGIIKCFKAKYQKKYIHHILDQFERGVDIRNPKNKLNIREAIDYVATSWNEVDELTMVNCWIKTGILPPVLHVDIELAQQTYLEIIEYEKNEIIDLTASADQIVLQEIDTYREINNAHIPMEETLDDSQIVEIVLAEELEREQGDPEDSGEKPPKISAFEELNGLKTFISFVEQMDNDFFFNNNDIKIFQKYSQLMRRITTESMEQKSIVDFFNQENQAINDEYLEDNFSGNNNDDEFSDNGNYSESDDIYLSDNFPNYDSLPDYNFPDYDDFSDNYGGSSDDYEN
ncbi:406_t:CDS:2, partial [Gigaspora rosea]